MRTISGIQKHKRNPVELFVQRKFKKTAGTICKTNQNTAELFAKPYKNPRNYMKTYKEQMGIVDSD